MLCHDVPPLDLLLDVVGEWEGWFRLFLLPCPSKMKSESGSEVKRVRGFIWIHLADFGGSLGETIRDIS